MSLPLPCADFLGNNLLASLLASPVALATSLVIASRESEALMPKLVVHPVLVLRSRSTYPSARPFAPSSLSSLISTA